MGPAPALAVTSAAFQRGPQRHCAEDKPSAVHSVSMTHAGGSRPLSLGVLLHIVTDQRGLSTSQAMP